MLRSLRYAAITAVVLMISILFEVQVLMTFYPASVAVAVAAFFCWTLYYELAKANTK
jgi:hypothetical protein